MPEVGEEIGDYGEEEGDEDCGRFLINREDKKKKGGGDVVGERT